MVLLCSSRANVCHCLYSFSMHCCLIAFTRQGTGWGRWLKVKGDSIQSLHINILTIKDFIKTTRMRFDDKIKKRQSYK